MNNNTTTTMAKNLTQWEYKANFTFKYTFNFEEVFEDELSVTKYAIVPIAILTIILNAVGLVIFYIGRARLFQKINNLHLLCMMLTDFFAGVLGLSWHFSLIYIPEGYMLQLPPALYFTAILENFLVVALYSLDRLSAVCFPFWHQQIAVTHFLKAFVVAQIFPLGFFIALVVLGSSETMISIFLLIQVAVAFLLAVSNTLVYRTARKQYQKILKTIVAHDQQEYSRHAQEIKRRQVSSIWLCLVFVVCFVTCWLPLNVNFVINSVQNKEVVYSLTRVILLLISSLNPLLVPIINFMLSQDIRREIERILNRNKNVISVSEFSGNSVWDRTNEII